MKKYATTGISLIGKVRRSNEDSFVYTDNDTRDVQIAIVADGIGSGSYGDLASRLTCELFLKQWEECQAYRITDAKEMKTFLINAVSNVNYKIFNQNLADEKTVNVPMGSTIVVLVLMPKDIVILHVGDSRCYELTDNSELILHTKGHTLYNKIADNIAKGILDIPNKPEYGNILTMAVGIRANLEDKNSLIQILERNENSRYLICSDGVAPIVPDETIKQLIISSPTNESALNKLISATYIAGASDNLTMIIL